MDPNMTDDIADSSPAADLEPNYSELDDIFNKVEPGESLTVSPPVDSSNSTEPVPEEPPSVQKRINQLTAKYKTEQTERLKFERELLAQREAFQILQDQFQAKQKRLSELEELDPRDQKIEEYELNKMLSDRQTKLEAEWSKREAELIRNAEIESLKERLLEKVEAAVTQYSTVSKHELALSLQRNPTADPVTLAKAIYDEKYAAYEKEFQKKYKTVMPTATVPQGRHKAKSIVSNEDLIADLDLQLGPDWNRRR